MEKVMILGSVMDGGIGCLLGWMSWRVDIRFSEKSDVFRRAHSAKLIVIVVIMAVLFMQAFSQVAHGQQLIGDASNGAVIYQQRCANCHGLIGLGDGELAAQTVNPPTQIGSSGYITNAVPYAMFGVITNGRLERGMPLFGEGSSNPLTEQERWDVIAYTYALGTKSVDVLSGKAQITPEMEAELATFDWLNLPNSLLDFPQEVVAFGRMSQFDYLLGEGQVLGFVTNGTTNQPVRGGEVILNVYEEFEVVEKVVGNVSSDGSFAVTVPNVAADAIYQAVTNDGDLEYTSNFVRFSADQLLQQANLTVYDTTIELDGVTLEMVRTAVAVTEDAYFIDQLYGWRNTENAVFEGGIPLGVPTDVDDLAFLSVSNGQLVPAMSVVEQGDGTWQETQPLLPERRRDLLVTFSIPRDGDVAIVHALPLPPVAAEIIVPEGVTVSGEWESLGVAQMQGQSVVTYRGEPLGELSFGLAGASAVGVDAETGQRVLIRNERRELMIGSAVLAGALVASAGLLYVWQKGETADPDDLLAEIAELDNARSAGEIKRQPYQQRRTELIQQIRDVWEG